MPTTPPPDLIARSFPRSVAAKLETASDVLVEVVNFCLAAFARCAQGSDYHGCNAAILFPYLHLVEMVDAVEVLVSRGAAAVSRLQVRAAFEGLLTIEYMLAEDTRRRAFAYLYVEDLLARRRILVASDPANLNGLRARLASSKRSAGMPSLTVPDRVARIAALDRIAERPEFRETQRGIAILRERGTRHPYWYQLYGGPGNLEQLACVLDRTAEYEIYYRTYSMTAHGADMIRQVAAMGDGRPYARPLRDPTELPDVTFCCAGFAYEATLALLGYFRPQEDAAVRRWWHDEVAPKLAVLEAACSRPGEHSSDPHGRV